MSQVFERNRNNEFVMRFGTEKAKMATQTQPGSFAEGVLIQYRRKSFQRCEEKSKFFLRKRNVTSFRSGVG